MNEAKQSIFEILQRGYEHQTITAQRIKGKYNPIKI